MKGIYQYLLLTGCLSKRLFHRKSFLICLIGIPLIIAGIQAGVGYQEPVLQAAFYMEPDTNGQIDEYRSELADLLKNEKGRVQFRECASEEILKKQVLSGKAECGYILQEDLQKRIEKADWDHLVPVLQSPRSVLTDTINEVFYGKIYEKVSVDRYAGYIAKSLDGKISEEQVVEKLRARMTDDSTFRVQYKTIDEAGTPVQDQTPELSYTDRVIKGTAAVLILLCGLAGGLDWLEDREKRRFQKKFDQLGAGILTIMVSVIWAVLIVIISMVVMRVCSWNSLVPEAGKLLLYGILVTGYACGIAWLFRSRRKLAAAIPVILIGSVVCSPLFMDLGQLYPVFKVLEKLFPVTYYLKL